MREDQCKDDRGQYINRWDHQRGANAFEERIAEYQYPQPRSERRDQRAEAIDDQAKLEAELATPDVRQFAARDHQCGHGEREEGDRRLDALYVCIQVLRNVIYRHVHIGARRS